jgi:hypothetical protein
MRRTLMTLAVILIGLLTGRLLTATRERSARIMPPEHWEPTTGPTV